MNVLIIDNYDSFTFNLYQFIGEILEREQQQNTIDRFDIQVKRNDEITLEEAKAYAPDRIIISPGPGTPADTEYFGVCADIIGELGKTTPLLGVCLGMQGIVHQFGGDIVKAPLPMHGKISAIHHNDTSVFKHLPAALEVMRYHSLIANPATFPEELEVTATVGQVTPAEFHTNLSLQTEFEIMGIRHKTFPIHGIQFHPESFATEGGKDLIRNFLLPT